MEVEVTENPELFSPELRDWVVSIGKELEQKQARRLRNDDGATVPTIFRVPPHLLKVSRESYTPKFFSFGLLDLHQRKISRLDDHRYEFASIFKGIVGIRRWSRICEKLVGSSVMALVGSYDDLDLLPEKDTEMVTNLLCLDAVFVVCFIQGRHQALCKTCREQFPMVNEVVQREPLWSRRSLVLFDIILFQNQIPLELISNVVDLIATTEKSRLRRILSTKSDDAVDPLHKIVVDALEMVYANLPGFLVLRETVQKITFRECKHLLHCLYNVICYDPLKPMGKSSRSVENGKADSFRDSPAPVQETSPLPSETPNSRSESQGRKEFGERSSLSRASVVPPTQEIVEDAQPGNVSFKTQAERVHFLFRGEDMARLFSPESRFGDGKRKVEEREYNQSSLEKASMSPNLDNATPDSMALSSDRALSLEKESPVSKIQAQLTPAALLRKSQAAEGLRTPEGHSSRREFRTPEGHSSRREFRTPEGYSSRRDLRTPEGYSSRRELRTPEGHSSRREFFGSQGKEKIVAHRLPEPLRGTPGSNLSTMRPWIASPRIFGDGSAWSLDSEPSSPQSQLSSRPASDRKTNQAAQEIGQSNLQTSFTPEPEKQIRQERASPGSSFCIRTCVEVDPAEPEDNQNPSAMSEWCPTLKCTGDSSPPRRSWSDETVGDNCKGLSDNASQKYDGSWSAFLFRCIPCAPLLARSSEIGVRIDHIPTLTQLKEIGIQVAVGKTRYISEVNFKKSRSGSQGTLFLPAFDVLEETEGLYRNLVTYEYIVEKKNDLLSYIHLMNNLTDTEEDVNLLIERGVIRANGLGSNKAVADMWRTLPSGYVITLSPQYQDLYDKISEHCSQIQSEQARKPYRTRPWFVRLLIFVILVVLLTLMATVVAAVYTVVTYYHAK